MLVTQIMNQIEQDIAVEQSKQKPDGRIELDEVRARERQTVILSMTQGDGKFPVQSSIQCILVERR